MFALSECGFPNVEMDLPLNVAASTPHFRAPVWNGPCGRSRSESESRSESKTKSKKSKKHKKHSKKHSKHSKKSGKCHECGSKSKSESKGKHRKDRCCPGRPGPVAQVIGFGAVRPEGPIEPFVLLLNGDGVVSPGLDAAAPLTAPYAYEAITTTTKFNLSASVDAPLGTSIDLVINVGNAALPPTNVLTKLVSVTAPFTLLTNLDLGVAAGNIVWITAATTGGVPNPDFVGITVELNLYLPHS